MKSMTGSFPVGMGIEDYMIHIIIHSVLCLQAYAYIVFQYAFVKVFFFDLLISNL